MWPVPSSGSRIYFVARIDRTRRVGREQASSYRDQGRVFLAAAEALEERSAENESYGSAIALLAVHAGIAHADALTIGFASKKSAGAHDRLPVLLVDVLGNRVPVRRRQQLIRLVGEKDSIAYQGKYYPLLDARKRLKEAREFADWAEQMLEERP